jgi:segregation and condensation protein B
MSLKAKLEAVIYAAEEPVTLAQFASLFAADALEWKQQKAAEAAAGQTEPETPQLPQLEEGMEYVELAEEAVTPEAAAPAVGEEPVAPVDLAPVAEASEAPIEPQAEAEAAPAEPAADPEAEAKKAARQRDREVRAILRELLDEIIASYAVDGRGVEIREIAGGYRMATKPECHDAVRLFIKSQKPALKLSLPALETLAVIAYKQPVTAPEVNEIRGVESGGVFGSLLSRKLITTAGRKQVIGRPILYKTTKEFLLRFGLKDVSELPSMEEFEKIAASELSEASEETESGFEHVESAGPELDPDASEYGEAAPVAESSAPEAVEAAPETAGAPDAEATASEPAPETVPEPQAEAVSHD